MRFARFRFCRSKSRKVNPADQQVPAGGKDKFGSTSETGQDECKGKVRCQATPSEPVTAVRCTSGSVSGAPSAEKVSFRIAKMFSSLKNYYFDQDTCLSSCHRRLWPDVFLVVVFFFFLIYSDWPQWQRSYFRCFIKFINYFLIPTCLQPEASCTVHALLLFSWCSRIITSTGLDSVNFCCNLWLSSFNVS